MSPYTLHLGDCLAGMAALADKSVGCVITDPPYTRHVHAAHAREQRADGARAREELSFDHLDAAGAVVVAHEIARVCKRWAVVFCAVEQTHEWRAAFDAADITNVRTGAWVKHACMPQITGDRPAAGMEGIVIGHVSGRLRWNGGGRPNVWTFTVEKVKRNEHPTQKPLPLMEALVRDFTDPGELVLDPFAGSGTTGVACIRNGRRFIGWEKDEKYHSAALKRLAAAREQFTLF